MSVFTEVVNVINEDVSNILESVNWNPMMSQDDLIFLIEIKGELVRIKKRTQEKLLQANNGEQQERGECNEQKRSGRQCSGNE